MPTFMLTTLLFLALSLVPSTRANEPQYTDYSSTSIPLGGGTYANLQLRLYYDGLATVQTRYLAILQAHTPRPSGEGTDVLCQEVFTGSYDDLNGTGDQVKFGRLGSAVRFLCNWTSCFRFTF